VQKWWKEISDAAQAFEARWMMLSLQRVDTELALALQQERDAFDHATIVGSCDEVENLGRPCVGVLRRQPRLWKLLGRRIRHICWELIL
jgi:hypothetical protein